MLDSHLVVLLNPKLDFLLLANINSAKVKFFPIEFLHTEHSCSRQPLKRQRYKLSQRYHFLLNTSLNHEFSCLLAKLYKYPNSSIINTWLTGSFCLMRISLLRFFKIITKIWPMRFYGLFTVNNYMQVTGMVTGENFAFFI